MAAILEQRSLPPALLLSLSLLAPSRGWAHQVPIAVRDLTLMGFLTSWNFRAEVMLVLAVLAGAFMSGWWRLQKQGQRGTARGWQATTYLTGLMVLGLALLSPIDRFASALFTLHMVQHLLLVTIAAPLVLLADPLPAQHLAMSAFRAVENQAYLIRAANTGISAIVAPDGRVVQAAGLFTPAVLSATIAPRP